MSYAQRIEELVYNSRSHKGSSLQMTEKKGEILFYLLCLLFIQRSKIQQLIIYVSIICSVFVEKKSKIQLIMKCFIIHSLFS